MGKLAVTERNRLNLADASILVVGGNAVEVDVLTQVFTGFGASQMRRADGTKTAQLALRTPTDLIVVDAMLGAEACFGLIRSVRRTSGDGRFCPIILTTSNAQPSLVGAARDSGVNYVVTKPLAPRVLFERLLYVVKEGRPFVECPTYAGPDRRFHMLGPPEGVEGRRYDDLAAEVGFTSEPNMSQDDIDSLMTPVRKKL